MVLLAYIDRYLHVQSVGTLVSRQRIRVWPRAFATAILSGRVTPLFYFHESNKLYVKQRHVVHDVDNQLCAQTSHEPALPPYPTTTVVIIILITIDRGLFNLRSWIIGQKIFDGELYGIL